MDALVDLQAGRRGETSVAILALVRPSTCVGALVVLVCRLLPEVFPALVATERFLPSVDALMLHSLRRRDEGFLAKGALVWSLAGVNAFVPHERRGAAEAPPTLAARVGFHATVDTLVPLQH